MALIHTPKLKKEPHTDPSSRSKSIEDCKGLLTSLPEGIYSMDWYGNFPKFKVHNDDNPDYGILEISIQNRFEFNKILQLKEPFRAKKIRICNTDLNCIESWTDEQVTQLSSRLEDIISGTYYY